MKFKILITIMLAFVSNKMISQTNEIINPKGKWFFGAEVGINTITSIHPEHENTIQGGILAEYYFAKHWSLNGRIKYFKTGVSFKNSGEDYLFDGAVISVPLNFKWEYRIIKNFSGNLKLGVALNQEVKNNYYYPTGAYKDYSSFFGTFNPGFGCNYFINIKTAIYINYEVFILGNSRDDRDWVSLPRYTTNNNLFNIGIKYNFKK